MHLVLWMRGGVRASLSKHPGVAGFEHTKRVESIWFTRTRLSRLDFSGTQETGDVTRKRRDICCHISIQAIFRPRSARLVYVRVPGKWPRLSPWFACLGPYFPRNRHHSPLDWGFLDFFEYQKARRGLVRRMVVPLPQYCQPSHTSLADPDRGVPRRLLLYGRLWLHCPFDETQPRFSMIPDHVYADGRGVTVSRLPIQLLSTQNRVNHKVGIYS